MRNLPVLVWYVLGAIPFIPLLGCGPKQPTPQGSPSAPAAVADAPTPSFPAPLDLTQVTGYEVSVLATHGKPIGSEKSHVDGIEHWFLNGRGQIVFKANKHTAGGGYIAADLYLATDGKTTLLLTQRHDGDHTGRRFSYIRAGWLNEAGQILVSGFQEGNRQGPQLFLIDKEHISPCVFDTPAPDSRPERPWSGRIGVSAVDIPALHFGPGKEVLFLASNREANQPEAIYVGNLDGVRQVLTANSDPSDPLGQFANFTAIYGTNPRGQILFGASLKGDDFTGQRLFLYTPDQRATDAKAPPGAVRELARHGGRLPGTKINLANNSGHDVWHMAALSERGDVVMIAETDRPEEFGGDADCLFILRPDAPWKMIAAAGSRIGKVKHPVQTFVAEFGSSDYRDHEQHLLRLEPDDSLTDLAHVGQPLKTGEQVSSLGGGRSPSTIPQILSKGHVVVQADLNIPSTPDHRSASVVLIDEQGMFEGIRLPDALADPPKYSNISIEEIQVNDAGYLGVVYSNGSHNETLLLAKPKYAK